MAGKGPMLAGYLVGPALDKLSKGALIDLVFDLTAVSVGSELDAIVGHLQGHINTVARVRNDRAFNLVAEIEKARQHHELLQKFRKGIQ